MMHCRIKQAARVSDRQPGTASSQRVRSGEELKNSPHAHERFSCTPSQLRFLHREQDARGPGPSPKNKPSSGIVVQ